jgi:hypothetical protein
MQGSVEVGGHQQTLLCCALDHVNMMPADTTSVFADDILRTVLSFVPSAVVTGMGADQIQIPLVQD